MYSNMNLHSAPTEFRKPILRTHCCRDGVTRSNAKYRGSLFSIVNPHSKPDGQRQAEFVLEHRCNGWMGLKHRYECVALYDTFEEATTAIVDLSLLIFANPTIFDAPDDDDTPAASAPPDVLGNLAKAAKAPLSVYTPANLRPAGYAKFKDLTATTVWGELIGWRAWRLTITPAGPRLLSSHKSVIWESGTVTSKDGGGNSADVFSEFHDAGWFAYKEASRLMIESEAVDVRVGGKVAMWGSVVEHRLGYRAECLKILTLEAIGPRAALVLDELREFYIGRA